jgi:hypothetical protein
MPDTELRTQLGRPDITSVLKGKFAYVRFFRDAATPAAPIAEVSIEDIQDISVNAMSQTDEKVFHYGGGKEYRLVDEFDGEYTGSMKLLSGGVPRFLAALLGKTWTLAGEAALPLGHLPRYPLCSIEAVLRKTDNYTHVQSYVYQDLIFDPLAPAIAMDTNQVDIPFRSNYDPFALPADAKMIMDKFSGDGSTTVFTLSQTPLTLVTATASWLTDWDFNTVAFVKLKLSAEDCGTRQKSGLTIVSKTVTFDDAPAAGSEITAFYAYSVV